MKALTVRQPWTSLIIAGHKNIENRGWPTNHRGKLAIHAGLAVDSDALARHAKLLRRLGLSPENLPKGRILGTVTVLDCRDDSSSPWAEPGLWHWVLANPRAFKHPVPAKGRLGLWEWARTPEKPWKSAL